MIELLLLVVLGGLIYFLFYRGYLWLFFLFLFCSWGGKHLLIDILPISSRTMIMFISQPISYAYFFAAIISFVATVFVARKME